MKLNITVDDSGHFNRTRTLSISQEQINDFLKSYFFRVGGIDIPAEMEELIELLEAQDLVDELFCHYMDDLDLDEDLDLDSCYSKTKSDLVQE